MEIRTTLGLSLQQSALMRTGFPHKGTSVSGDEVGEDSVEARPRVSKVRRIWDPDQRLRSMSRANQRFRSRRSTVSEKTTPSSSPVSARIRNRIGNQPSLSRVATEIAIRTLALPA